MAFGSGLGAQLGIAAETTFGTYAAPTLFLPFEQESLTVERGVQYYRGLGERTQSSNRRRVWITRASGGITCTAMTDGIGLVLEQMLGAVATSNPDPVNEPNLYRHVFTPDPDGLAGVSATVQVGRPTIDGTVRPFNYLGGKVVDWTLSIDVDGNLQIQTNWNFKTVETTTALAAASLSSTQIPFSFIDGTFTIDGVEKFIKNFSVQGNNGLNVDRRFIRNQQREPVAANELTVTGSFEMEWEDPALFNAFINGTTAALEMTFAFGEIDSGQDNPFTLTISLPEVEFTGDTPTVSSSDILPHTLPFKALNDGVNEIITITYDTTDETP